MRDLSSDKNPASAAAEPTASVGMSELISELLMGMRLSGLDYRRLELTTPFGVRFDTPPGRAQFHFVARGELYLLSPEGVVQRLVSGDAVLLPRGGTHTLVSAEDVPCRHVTAIDDVPVSEAFSCASNGCDHDDAEVCLFGGCMALDLGSMQPLIAQMPEVLHVGTLLKRNPELPALLEAMEREAGLARVGAAGILSRLADVVAASLLRGWVECGCGASSGWLQALRDPQLSRVIAAVHRSPGKAWTVADMAREAGQSRTIFAERFRAMTHTTPLEYVTGVRMRLATQWLAREQLSLDIVADRLGYGSRAAFSRAFKRATGHTPGLMRAGQPARVASPH